MKENIENFPHFFAGILSKNLAIKVSFANIIIDPTIIKFCLKGIDNLLFVFNQLVITFVNAKQTIGFCNSSNVDWRDNYSERENGYGYKKLKERLFWWKILTTFVWWLIFYKIIEKNGLGHPTIFV